MGFDKGLQIVKGINEKYDAVREEALNVHSSRQAAFGVIGEILVKAEKILAYLRELENVIEVKDGIGVFCGAWAYIHEGNSNVARRVKPVLSVRVKTDESLIIFRNQDLGITLSPGKLTLRYRGFSLDVALTRDDITLKADIIKSLASKMLYLMDSILLRIETCSKYQYNIRI